jgi:hypothetical protein
VTLLTPAAGTPATTSQMAKDVATFLHWAAEPEHDERKKNGITAVILFSALTAISLYAKRFKWSPIKARKIGAAPPPAALSRVVLTLYYSYYQKYSLQPAGGQGQALNQMIVVGTVMDEIGWACFYTAASSVMRRTRPFVLLNRIECRMRVFF